MSKFASDKSKCIIDIIKDFKRTYLLNKVQVLGFTNLENIVNFIKALICIIIIIYNIS